MKLRYRNLLATTLIACLPLVASAQTLRIGLAEDPDLLDPTLFCRTAGIYVVMRQAV